MFFYFEKLLSICIVFCIHFGFTYSGQKLNSEILVWYNIFYVLKSLHKKFVAIFTTKSIFIIFNCRDKFR